MGSDAYVALGSNIEPFEHIEQALALLEQRVGVLGVSSFFRTAPIGAPGQPDYVNGIARIPATEDAHSLKFGILREIENELGRLRSSDKYAPRSIDLDILLFANEVIDQPGLEVPDPDIRTRPFLAAGLLELWPKAELPDGTRVATLFDENELRQLIRDTEFSQRMRERFGV